jgi:hypothetical protein
MIRLGSAVRLWREENKLTQARAADKLTELVDHPVRVFQLARVESWQLTAASGVVRALARYFEVKL